jgi:hypothetical protein
MKKRFTRSLREEATYRMNLEQPLVSVIIPGKNEGKTHLQIGDVFARADLPKH